MKQKQRLLLVSRNDILKVVAGGHDTRWSGLWLDSPTGGITYSQLRPNLTGGHPVMEARITPCWGQEVSVNGWKRPVVFSVVFIMFSAHC